MRETCPCCLSPAPFEVNPYGTNPTSGDWTYDCFVDKSVAACPTCASTFLHEVLTDEELDRWYRTRHAEMGTASAVFDRDTSLVFHEFTRRPFQQALFLKTHVNLPDGVRILEIGAGHAGILPSLSLFCRPDYMYFDQAKSPIIHGYGARHLGTFFGAEQANDARLKGTIDLVVLSHSLEHINPSSLEPFLGSIRTVLKDTGRLFVEVPDEEGSVMRPPHTLTFTEAGFRSLLPRCGFEVLSFHRAAKRDVTTNGRPGHGRLVGWSRRLIWMSIKAAMKVRPVSRGLRNLLIQYQFPRRVRSMTVPNEDDVPYYRLLAGKASS